MGRSVPVVGTLLVLAVCLAACGGQKVADPFPRGVSGGRVVANEVICDPTPTTCGRYVVIDPLPGSSRAALIRSVEAAVRQKLGWDMSDSAPVPSTQGVAFDGPNSHFGAYVNTATAELRLDAGDLDAGASASTGKRLLSAMRMHPSAVVVRIIHA